MRIPRPGMDEGVLEAWMRDALRRRREPRAQLRAGGAHPQVGRDRLPPPDPAGHEHRHLPCTCGRISCASTPSDTGPMCPPASDPSIDQRVHPGPHQPLRQAPAPARSRSPARRRPSPAEPPPPSARRPPAPRAPPRDARHTSISASSCGCMVMRFTPNGSSVRAWVPAISAASMSGPHGAAGDHAEPAGVADRRDQVPLAHPAHRAAQDRGARAQERRPPRPQPIQPAPARPRRPEAWLVRRHRGRRRCAARAPPAPCTRPRSARSP